MDTSTSKPDLIGSASRPKESKRILAQLEHGARLPARPVHASGWTIDGWTIGLFFLLALMCSVAWLMHDKTITPSTFRHSGTGTSAHSARKAPMLASELTPATDNAPPAIEAAAIINVAAEPKPDPAPGPAKPIAAAPSSTPARATSVQPKTVTTAARPLAASAPPAAPTQTDTDITLLTALVAHASKPSLVTPERSRDVVERQEGDSTNQLLARCKQLGVIEGMLCRSRICSGRWETDTACRAPAH